MAIFNNGINGGFTGKVGSVIGYPLNGKWIMKGLPKPSAKNKRGTVKQNVCRSGFTKMQYFLQPLINLVRVGFNLESKRRQMTAHNVAKSYNMLHAQASNGEIDYAKILVTYGNLLGVAQPSVMVNDAGLHFNWTNNSDGDWDRKRDQVMLLAYDVENENALMCLSGARRHTGSESLDLHPSFKGREFHTWMAFIADNRESISMSMYTGSYIF